MTVHSLIVSTLRSLDDALGTARQVGPVGQKAATQPLFRALPLRTSTSAWTDLRRRKPQMRGGGS